MSEELIKNDSHKSEILISVIVTAYYRKEFLIRAVKSILNQSLERDRYEIILTKNFLDPVIDSYLKENNVIMIYDEIDGLGPRLSRAIRVARGKIISFLEDDDCFAREKLETIAEIFRTNHGLDYYRNEFVSVDRDGNTLNNWRRGLQERIVSDVDSNLLEVVETVVGNQAMGNVSSISLSSDFGNSILISLAGLVSSVDTFLFYSALDRAKLSIFDNSRLTIVTIHDSVSRIFTEDLSEFVERSKTLYERTYKDLSTMYEVINDEYLRVLLKDQILESKINMRIFGKNKNNPLTIGDFLAYFRNIVVFKKGTWSIMLAFMAIMAKISTEAACKVYFTKIEKRMSSV